MKRSFQKAFILHSRPYKESSALIDLLTAEGRFRAVLRKARSKVGSVARPFVPLEVMLQGKGELKTVIQLDATANHYPLQQTFLFSGFYLNELLMRLLPLEDAYPTVFEYYHLTLKALSESHPVEPLLREFEWCLLTELGYGFSLEYSAEGEAILADAFYIFNAESGLVQVTQRELNGFYGADLLAMNEAQWNEPSVLNAAKRLMRQVLAVHLQGKPLASRELFISPQ